VLIVFLIATSLPLFFLVDLALRFIGINEILFTIIITTTSIIASLAQLPNYYIERTGKFTLIATNELISQIVFFFLP